MVDGVKAILEELLGVPGVQTAVVIGWDGFTIDSASTEEMDVEAVGAVVSTGIGSGQIMGGELGLGEFAQAMFEYDKGLIILSGVGDRAILAVIAEPEGNLGFIRYQVRKQAPRLLEKL